MLDSSRGPSLHPLEKFLVRPSVSPPSRCSSGSAPTSCRALGSRARAGVPGGRASSWLGRRPGGWPWAGAACSLNPFRKRLSNSRPRAPCVRDPAGGHSSVSVLQLSPLPRQCSRRSGGAQGRSELPTVSGYPLGPLRGEDEGPGLHVGSHQGDPPDPGLERRRLVQGDIVCPSAPTPETKGANEPRASESLSLKPGKPSRLRPPAALRSRAPEGWCLPPTVSPSGWTLLGRTRAAGLGSPRGASSLFRVVPHGAGSWESQPMSWRD